MKKACSFSIPMLSFCGAALALGLSSPAGATPILGSYTGSYSVVTQQPVTDGVASFRLTLAPLFADCDTAGECTELVRGENLGTLATGRSFTMWNQPVVLAALTNGEPDLFSLSMNFGPVFSSALSGGSAMIFDTPLASAYAGGAVESIVLTIDQLLFRTVATPFGLGTEAALTYTIALVGPAPAVAMSLPQQLLFVETPAAPVPEPATWLIVGCGLCLLATRKR